MSNNSVPKSPIVWPGSGTSTQLASAAGTPITLGSGSSISSATFNITTPITIFDCDFTAQSNYSFSVGVAKTVTDSLNRSLPFKLSTVGTASAAFVNGSGLGFTTAGNVSRSIIYTEFSNISRAPLGPTYRFWLKWSSYSAASFGSTANLFTGMTIAINGIAPPGTGLDFYRNNPANGSPQGSWYAGWQTEQVNNSSIASFDVMVFEQTSGNLSAYVGQWSSGWPSFSSLRPIAIGLVAKSIYGMSNGTPTLNNPVDMSNGLIELQFCNAVDSTTRTIYATNFRCDIA